MVWSFGHTKVRSQVMSPTPSLRSAEQRLHPIHHASRRRSFCSAYNTSEDATPAPVSSEVDERQSIRRQASPLFMQKREASAIPTRIFHSTGESCMSGSSHIPSTENLVAVHSHKRKSSRDKRGDFTNERIRDEQQEVKDFFKNQTRRRSPRRT